MKYYIRTIYENFLCIKRISKVKVEHKTVGAIPEEKYSYATLKAAQDDLDFFLSFRTNKQKDEYESYHIVPSAINLGIVYTDENDFPSR